MLDRVSAGSLTIIVTGNCSYTTQPVSTQSKALTVITTLLKRMEKPVDVVYAITGKIDRDDILYLHDLTNGSTLHYLSDREIHEGEDPILPEWLYRHLQAQTQG